MKISLLAWLLGGLIILATLIGLVLPIEQSLPLWIVIDRLGDAEGYIVLTLAIYFLVHPWVGYFSLLLLLISGIINIFLKDLFRIPRPEDMLIEAEGYSFPSGHAQTSGTFWGSIYSLFRSNSILVVAAPFLAMVSISRLVLRVHTPLDVAAGLAIGLGIAYTTKYFVGLYREVWTFKLAIHLMITTSALIVYLGSGYSTLVKIAGVSAGLVVHPLIADEISLKLRTRLLTYIVFLIPAFLLTRLAGGPLWDFIVYAFIGAAAPVMLYKLAPQLDKVLNG